MCSLPFMNYASNRHFRWKTGEEAGTHTCYLQSDTQP